MKNKKKKGSKNDCECKITADLFVKFFISFYFSFFFLLFR